MNKYINMNRLFYVLLITAFSTLGFSQVDNLNTFTTKAKYDGNEVRLRWVPATEEMWKSSRVNGITIERITVINNEVELSVVEQAESRVTLVSDYKPVPENEWDATFSGSNKYAAVAKSNLYSSEYDVTISGATTLADAFNHDQTAQSKYLFTMFCADQDWDVAKGVAMAFVDASVEPNMEYIYGLKLTVPDEDLTTQIGLCQVSTSETVAFPPVSINEAQGGDHEALLSWSQEDLIDFYSSYDIERSTDNIHYVKVNENPFVFMGAGEDASEEVFYRDSLPANNVTYYYRIKGRSPFGEIGPPSLPEHVVGKPARLSILLGIPQVTMNADNILLDWSHLPAETGALIKGFDVLRSISEDGEYTKINNSMLSAATRDYTDNDLQDQMYYKYVAYDYNDYDYPSISVLAQVPDSIPPAPPVGLSGAFVDNYEANLEWEENQEDDVSGYKVYASNQEDGTYIDVTKSPTKLLQFTHRIDPTMGGENVYFKMKAIDHNDNYSDFSEAFVLKRPDILPPAKPSITKVLPTPEGVIFTWNFSSSQDVQYHALQRTKIGTPNWTDLVSIDKSDEDGFCTGSSANNPGEAICYTDDDALEPGEYKYRLVAVDDAQNISASKIYTVTPYIASVAGEIVNISIQLETTELPPDTSFNSLLATVKDKIRNADDFVDNGTTIYNTKLRWQYTLDETLKDFMIYRMITSGTMIQYQVVTLEEAMNYDPSSQDIEVQGDLGLNPFQFVDENLEPGRRYSYQVVARHINGTNSNKSKMVTIKIP